VDLEQKASPDEQKPVRQTAEGLARRENAKQIWTKKRRLGRRAIMRNKKIALDHIVNEIS